MSKKLLMYISQNYSFAILRPLQAAAIARGDEVRWFVEGSDVDRSFFQSSEVVLDNVEEIVRWQPDAVFVPGNVVPDFIPGLKVAVFHGFDAGKLNRRGRNDHFSIRGCFDLYCTQGPNTTEPFQQLAHQRHNFLVKQTGWSALDPLFSNQQVGNPYINHADQRKTLLMCSTFSKRLTCAPHLFPVIKRFAQEGKWRILVQFHPKMDKDIIEQYKAIQNDNLTFVETDNIIPLLQAADVMLCDTSSVLLMFLLLRKPVVTFRNVSPESHLLDIQLPDEVEAAIDLALTHPPELMRNIEEYCQQLHPYCDGLSSERVLAEVDQSLMIGRIGKKPLNLIRMLKLRKKLNYWKFTK